MRRLGGLAAVAVLSGGCKVTDAPDTLEDLVALGEKHLSDNGTIIVKFFLNVSFKKQTHRLLQRIDEPSSNWKFNPGDVKERERWPEYMRAFEDALNQTSRPWAPWYAIPADNKPYMRLEVARIVQQTLEHLGVDFPKIDEATRASLAKCRETLERQ